MRLLLAALMAFDAVLAGVLGGHWWWALPAVVSAGLFARKDARWGWLCLICAGIVIQPLGQRFLFFSGTCLLGWLCGHAWRKINPALAERGAVSALAAGYLGAFLSKLFDAGWGWSAGLQATLAGQHVWGQPTDSLVQLILDHPALAQALGVFTLLAEASAALMPFSRRGRMLSGSLLLAFHAGVWLLTPIFFPQAMVLLAALSFRRIPEVDARIPAAATAKAAALAAALAAVAWLPPVRAFTRPAPPAQPPSAASRARLGSVVEGTQLGGVTVTRIDEPSPGVIRLQLGDSTVELVPHGQRPLAPPRTAGNLDLYFHGGNAPDAVLDALAERLRR